MGEQMDSAARPACSWPHDARHIARHGCSPLFHAPPRSPFLPRCPQFCPLCARLGVTRAMVGVWRGGVWGGGGRLTPARVPPPGSFPFGGPMHALPVRV